MVVSGSTERPGAPIGTRARSRRAGRHENRIRARDVERKEPVANERVIPNVHLEIAPARIRLSRSDPDAKRPRREFPQGVRLLPRRARTEERHGCQATVCQEGGRGRVAPEGLGYDARVEERQAASVVLRGHEHAGDAQLGQLRPEGDHPVRRLRLGQLASASDRHLFVEKAPDAVLEQPLLVGESEVHQPCPSTNFGSRGIPSPRSEMMFFWIWAVPPPMMSPIVNMY